MNTVNVLNFLRNVACAGCWGRFWLSLNRQKLQKNSQEDKDQGVTDLTQNNIQECYSMIRIHDNAIISC